MDGRIASADDSLDFLNNFGERVGAETEWPEFVATLDAAVVGAGTMRWLLRQGHGWPHVDLPTWLVSHEAALLDSVGGPDSRVVRFEGEVGALFAEVEAAGHDHVWLCGGGDLAGQALAADRIDEVLVTIAPTVLGAGPALFDGAGLEPRRFELAECRDQGGNAARLRWVRAR